jgi:serine protease Do
MTLSRPWLLSLVAFGLTLSRLCADPVTLPKDKDDPFIPALAKKSPATVAELRALQKQVQKVAQAVTPCTVGILIGGASGSGVIVSADGLVLTAGHVSGKADQTCTLVLSDGRRVKGKTLGANNGIDSGMITITEGGPYPYADMGDSKGLTKGQWCVSIGHPNGVQPGRPPVVRLGRVITANDTLIQTDCTLVGGDSGGPLFDLDGKVIGIHSRIGFLITANIHVPVETYRVTWDRLVKGEVWGGKAPGRVVSLRLLGFRFKRGAEGLVVEELKEGSPAAKCGLRVDDKVVACGGSTVDTTDELVAQLKKKAPGETVRLEVDRDGLKVILLFTLPSEKE